MNSSVENVLAFDKCGNVLTHLIGERTRVTMPAEIWNAAKVVTHNHPDGATLSAEDISHLFDTKVSEIRAVSGDVWYSAKRSSETPSKTAETVNDELSSIISEAECFTIHDLSEHNGISAEIDTENNTVKAVKPENMSDEEFDEKRIKTIREAEILRIIRLHKALDEYAKKNHIIYTVGELAYEDN